MTKVLHTPADLVSAGLAPAGAAAELESVAARYAIAVTPTVAALINPADPNDPIGLQYLPSREELETAPDEQVDPIGDGVHSPLKGIVHRYPDRLLLTATHACAVYCRFCFRREVVGPGGAGGLTPAELDAALAYISDHPEVWEVILTGGDPLVLSPRRIADLVRRIADIPHVKVLRVHTRLPVAEPERVSEALVSALSGSRLRLAVGVHVNHARELTPAADAALARLAGAGALLLSQTVLLKGVNDRVQVLGELMRALVERGVRPYYLHHPDPAPGTARFRVSLAEGQALVRGLRGRYSGLCQPTYILDIPGGFGKVPAGPAWIEPAATGLTVTDPWGGIHALPEES
ncbi:MAG: lysine-2,3-aminomutase-like protein [Phenylobacterium sp.]|uniref:lysine-2,3-aminomutase-like protein n=1 Tax=Phenylobacterium sp. TaxID=1871053 RepID=UPI0025DF7094|nr:lysine-2,3-aminomutase-like protein [Phenylobacterium sp.]MCA3711133.1 lysine-2,3-aminomutase-like protein [Phenylobacterium sp.]MCA3724633.1 lysine-2,3-aminomutase-like protein [Phenylobacterium sp.]MCA3732580.1 lysine-2,3-aminomutase-like protein [Phenylobacterium sp.]MCA3746697.1 lysine-2,3-aminomutase-like protein [Phenylobacterium sp.]MCA3750450.1 lysine-2,3-aminomutase-like protein [Phenylobacterium sp.]